ncbi:hypothetical protein C8R48DRAFT_726354 [Suillus tomentosus]|nr:hypothetical protein C8R48DRAFT_726354 [Suillus tomentosus]
MTMSPSSSVQHSPPVDLRRMTSNSTLLTPQKDSIREHRLSTHTSQHLNTTRMGSRSPSSIPSSPTSAHSSSSAIFERDIEPMHPPSPPSHPNPHRIARAKGTEQLEHSVPSVLDSAASILAASSPMEEDHISVLSPSRDRDRLTTSGFASPIGSLRSRSPSPSGRTSLLLSIPSQQGPITPLNITPGVGAGSPQRLSIQTSPLAFPSKQGTSGKASAAPSISTPASVYYSTLSSVEPSPTTTTAEHPSSALPPIAISTLSPSSTYTSSPYIRPITISHPPSPTHGPTKRLSFMSYADLLASTPASMVPLSSFTTCATPEPPPHIPGVEGYALNQHDAASLSGRERDSIAMLDDIGGEWQREGLGRGLEERLEALMIVPSKA